MLKIEGLYASKAAILRRVIRREMKVARAQIVRAAKAPATAIAIASELSGIPRTLPRKIARTGHDSSTSTAPISAIADIMKKSPPMLVGICAAFSVLN